MCEGWRSILKNKLYLRKRRYSNVRTNVIIYVMTMATARTESASEFELTGNEIEDMVTIFKALADPSRLRILATLARGKDVSVSDIAELLDMSVSRVSHHLTLLEHLGFVKGTQEGKQVFHHIDDDCIMDIMRRSKEHVSGQ